MHLWVPDALSHWIRFPKAPPDLAIEVVSPSNTPREIYQRISDYVAAGYQRVWLVYPEDREVYIHGLAGVTRRSGNDLLEDPELLPGFSMKVPELFEERGARHGG